MSRLISVDLVDALHTALRGDVRPPDGKLHASSDLVSSLRHSQLRAAGAPTIDSELLSDVTLMTGTFWHQYFGKILVAQGIPFMQEVKLDAWLPEGWSGTADWLIWHPKYQAFSLGDLKTSKGEAMRFIYKDGAKTEHLWQLSAYWYALERMGLPLLRGFSILYLPKNNTSDKSERIEPILLDCEPLPEAEVAERMESRWAATKAYLDALWHDGAKPDRPHYLNDALAPVQERVQKLWWDNKAGYWNVKLVPHWSAAFCPYPSELCNCNEVPDSEKIGHWFIDSDHEDYPLRYEPRKGYEHIEPELKPDEKEYNKRL